MFAKAGYSSDMATMNISLPASLKAFVEQKVAEGGYSTSSEYVRELLRKEQDRSTLRRLLLEGASSPSDAVADDRYFRKLRQRIEASDRD